MSIDPVGHAIRLSARPKHLPSLQVLRFAAAFSVVLFHVGSGLVLQYDLSANPFSLGSAGVDIFFVLSGFIISYTTDPAKGILHFARRRIARVVPLYWGLTLAIIIIALVRPNLLNSTVVSTEAVIRSFLFIPYEKSNGAIQPLLFLGWTLCYEMFFYLIYGACLMIGRHAGWLASAILLFLVGLHALWPEGSVEWRFYTSPILIEFVLGIMLQKVFSSLGLIKEGSLLLALTALLAAPAVHYATSYFIPGIVPSALFAVLMVTGFLFWRMPKGRVIACLMLLGDASYSLYLIHPYMLQLPLKFLGKDASLPLTFAVLGAVVALTAAFSVVLYRLGERPFQALLMGSGRRLSQAELPAS